MSDETTTPTPTPTPIDGSDLRTQMRAIASDRSRLAGECARLTAELKTATERGATLQGQIKAQGTRHDQDLHLSGLGISSSRGRRAIRREYNDALSELGENDEAPPFSEFCEELKDDQLYGRWFAPAQATPETPTTTKRRPASDPNAGTSPPQPPDSPLDLKTYQARRTKVGRKMAIQAGLERLKKEGIIV